MNNIPCSVPNKNFAAPASMLLSMFVPPYSLVTSFFSPFSSITSVFVRYKGLSVCESISTGNTIPLRLDKASLSLISHHLILPSVLLVANSFEFFDFNHTKSLTGSVCETSTFVIPIHLFSLRS
jgi:hypothetical protein